MTYRSDDDRGVVAGLFNDRERAARAIHDLREQGFSPEEIGAAMRDRSEQGELIADYDPWAGKVWPGADPRS